MNKQEELLRGYITDTIRLVKKKRSIEEQKLRLMIREFLHSELKTLNEARTPDNDPTPHTNTGINVLEDLLKKIIPVLETDYKLLTTDPVQRKSFRAHIINAVIDSLTQVEANNAAMVDKEIEDNIEEEIDIDVVEDPEQAKFIDIDPEEPEEEVEEDPQDTFGIEGEDLTGRNMAYASYKKVESSVVDAYDLLGNEEDQELFYDYLVANLKLYFDKFETELGVTPEEPTSQAYQTAKKDSETGEEEIELEI